MDKLDITLRKLLVDRATFEALGFLIHNWYFDEPVRGVVRLNLQSVQGGMPLEDSVEILVHEEDKNIQASILYDKVVSESATTAGGRPLVWDDKHQFFRLDGIRYSGRYGGLVRESMTLDNVEAQTIASFLGRCNIKYSDETPNHRRKSVERILNSFIRQYSPN